MFFVSIMSDSLRDENYRAIFKLLLFHHMYMYVYVYIHRINFKSEPFWPALYNSPYVVLTLVTLQDGINDVS